MPRLCVFDFDNTLFRSPLNTPKNQRLFEEQTGIPWIVNKQLARELSSKHGRHIGMRSGWFGRAETLEPPLVPDPVTKDWFIEETVTAFFERKNDPDCKVIIMTGRHAGIQGHVLRILKQGELIEISESPCKDGKIFRRCIDPAVDVYFLGMDGPLGKEAVDAKPSDTFNWKCWILNQFYLWNNWELFEIWEDRLEHVEAFKKWGETIDTPVSITHVLD